MPTNKETAEDLVRPVLESWFGESIDDMEDSIRVKRYLLAPLIERVEQELDERDQDATPEEGISREID